MVNSLLEWQIFPQLLAVLASLVHSRICKYLHLFCMDTFPCTMSSCSVCPVVLVRVKGTCDWNPNLAAKSFNKQLRFMQSCQETGKRTRLNYKLLRCFCQNLQGLANDVLNHKLNSILSRCKEISVPTSLLAFLQVLMHNWA